MTSTTRTRALILAAGLLSGLGFLAGLGTARAAGSYDGNWSVEVVTERGECDRAYRYGVIIENGRVRYAGGRDFEISGQVAANGSVRGSIVRGDDRADVTGRLDASSGRGTWTASGGRKCGGSWSADRRGG